LREKKVIMWRKKSTGDPIPSGDILKIFEKLWENLKHYEKYSWTF
jgi:hypothetical protein